jgi:hypothetical protein
VRAAIGPQPIPLPSESFTVRVNVAVVGPTTLFTPQADRRWVATALVLVPAGAVTVQLNSGATAIVGPMALAANVPLVVVGDAARNVLRALDTGDTLTVTLGGAVQVGGWVQLREEGAR